MQEASEVAGSHYLCSESDWTDCEEAVVISADHTSSLYTSYSRQDDDYELGTLSKDCHEELNVSWTEQNDVIAGDEEEANESEDENSVALLTPSKVFIHIYPSSLLIFI